MNKNTNQTLVIQNLNILLSSVSINLSNLKAYHWNIVGKDFFVLHKQFSDIYDYMSLTQDQIAERIRALDKIPLVGYSNYLKDSLVLETTANITFDSEFCLTSVVKELKIINQCAQAVKSSCVETMDNETDNFMQEIIFANQKIIWQLNSQNK
jgi:starvation-inducible DNA-binding protein